MQAFVPWLSMTLLSLASPALAAAPSWEICLDKANFSYDEDISLLSGSTYSAAKKDCKMTFAISGGKGEKWVVDLCDAGIHIDHYPTLDATAKRIFAGSAGCPAPLFGADFDNNAKEINEYKEARDKLFEVWEKVRAGYTEGSEKVDLTNPSSFSPEKSSGQIACGQFLLTEYLKKCMSFEEKKPEPARAYNNSSNSGLIGVHPQTIPKP